MGESDNLTSLHVSAFTRQSRLTAITKIHASGVPVFLSFFLFSSLRNWNIFLFIYFCFAFIRLLKKVLGIYYDTKTSHSFFMFVQVTLKIICHQ